MPRKKQMTEEELIREKERIEQQIKEIRIKENVDVGIMVRQIFGKEIPNDKAGRKAFFTKLYKKNRLRNQNRHLLFRQRMLR